MDSGAAPPRHRDAVPSTPPGPAAAREEEASQQANGNSDAPGGDATDAPPPFWTSSPSRHGRSVSYQSVSQLQQRRRSGGPIQLEDHSEEDHVQAQSCWAESASVDEYVVVSGATGIGAYVVWHCTVKTLKGGDLEIRKRYDLPRSTIAMAMRLLMRCQILGIRHAPRQSREILPSRRGHDTRAPAQEPR